MWYYNLNNQPAGPVDEAALKTLFARGVINFDTLVWQEGEPAWIRLGETQIIGQVVAAEAAGSPARQVVALPGKPTRHGLKKLFVWWLVTTCFFVLFIVFNFGTNFILPNLDAVWSTVLISLACIFELPLFTSVVLEYILLYKYWNIIQDGYASTTAAKAVGFMFIPLFNYYWIFRAFWGLAKDLNRYIDRHFHGQPEESPRRSKEWISLTYLIFGFVGGALLYVLVIVYIAVMMPFETYVTSMVSGDFFSVMLPITVMSLVYMFGLWGLKTVMFIDFYRTSDSILEAEEAQ